MALHQPGHNDWYRIRNQIQGPTQLHIYDEIGYFGVSASDLVRDLADVTGPLEVHLNSPGGEVFDGIAIYNALVARKDVTVMIDGIAASIASVIAMAGNPVLVARQGTMMVHDGFGMSIGNAQDMREMADLLDKTSNNIASIYSDHTGKPAAYWRDIMKAETWFSGQEAIDHGLADRFIDSGAGRPVTPPQDSWDLSAAFPGLRGAATVPYVGHTQHRHEPMTGFHAHDHAAFTADDGDDGAHAHQHEHQNDADHNPDTNPHHTHTPGMGEEDGQGRVLEGYYDPSVTGIPMDIKIVGNRVEVTIGGLTQVYDWDAAAAMAKCKTASDYRSICAGEKSSGDPDTQAHWALPHHNSPGAGPDKGGVVAALGRWNQTQGLKNKDAALSHLKAHARSLGLPSGDDDSNQFTNPWLDPTPEEMEHFLAALKGA